MTHRFPVKEIAAQSGLSTATVDRVLNGRAHVSPQTRARVAAALEELVAQEAQLAARGRRLFVDIVVEAPERFSREVRAAALAGISGAGPAVIRPRFAMAERMTAPQVAAVLDRIGRRGSGGVILKGRDEPPVRAAVQALAARCIPVVTLVTDVADSGRVAYVGPDNAQAGRMAAWLVDRFLPGAGGAVLLTQSAEAFEGETTRRRAFLAELAERRPDLRFVEASGGGGLNIDTGRAVDRAVAGRGDLRAVYSMGGGNLAVLAALDRAGIQPEAFVAHDLDTDNRRLLAEGRLTVVLHHDLAQDLAGAFRQIVAAHRLLPPEPARRSEARVITPVNLPLD